MSKINIRDVEFHLVTTKGGLAPFKDEAQLQIKCSFKDNSKEDVVIPYKGAGLSYKAKRYHGATHGNPFTSETPKEFVWTYIEASDLFEDPDKSGLSIFNFEWDTSKRVYHYK